MLLKKSQQDESHNSRLLIGIKSDMKLELPAVLPTREQILESVMEINKDEIKTEVDLKTQNMIQNFTVPKREMTTITTINEE